MSFLLFKNLSQRLYCNQFSKISITELMRFLPTCRRSVMSYDPEHYCKRLGQRCEVCTNYLSHEKCLSLCKCYLFCHQPCFLKQLEPILTDQDADIKCSSCKEVLAVNLEAVYTYSPHRTTSKCIKLGASLLLLVLCIIGIVLTTHSSILPDVAFILIYIEGLMLGFSLYLVGMNTKELLYKKSVRIKQIQSTKLQIQTSAFKDIDIETNEEITKDYLIFESKKERE